MVSAQEIATAAFEHVSNSPSQEMIGARLGALLRSQFPDFTPLQFQSRNLRQFVRSYVPKLTEKSHLGGFDVIFVPAVPSTQELINAPISAPQVPASTAMRAGYVRPPLEILTWRVYSNPSNPRKVVLNTASSEISTVGPDVSILSPWVTVEKPTAQRHLEIAHEFVDTVQPEAARLELGRTLKAAQWYQQFSPVTKRHNLGAAWAAFRIRRLSSALEQDLTALGISLSSIKSARVPPGIESFEPNTGVSTGPRHPESDEQLRAIAIRAIQTLSIEDLRTLKFPLGVILSAVAAR